MHERHALLRPYGWAGAPALAVALDEAPRTARDERRTDEAPR
jgi:hypothetical protein